MRGGPTRLVKSWGAAALAAALLAAAPAATAEEARPGSYRIGPKDLVEIRVFEVPELNVERRVNDEGKINLPLIGDVIAQGLTDAEFAARLGALLEAKYVQRASVAVQIKEFRSRPIVVMGAVRSPGNLSFSGRWTLLEVLSAVGGVGDKHAGSIFVMRRAANGLTDQIEVSVEDLVGRADPDVNLPIFANDIVNVPATTEVTVFCLGEFGTSGAITFRSTDRITLLTVVARAGGLSDRASRKIQVKRRGADGRDVTLEFDYKRVLAGKEIDPTLQDGDVLVAKESFF